MLSYFDYKFLKRYTLAICFLILFSAFITSITYATDFYIKPSGGSNSNDGLTQSTPWATFSHAMGNLSPGDTLYLMNGTYTETLNITVSGINGNPVTFKALNDGKAILDGTRDSDVLRIAGTASSHKTDIKIEGVVCKNAYINVVSIHYADRIILKRVSAYDAGTGNSGNVHQFSLWHASDVLLEDCAAAGYGRVPYNALDCDSITFRRCFVYYEDSVAGGVLLQLYGSDNCRVENCVGFQDADKVAIWGITVWCHNYNASADNNKIYGNVVRDVNSNFAYHIASAQKNIIGNEFKHNVSIDSAIGFRHAADGNLVAENFTIVGSTMRRYQLESYDNYYTLNTDFKIGGTLKNSSFMNGNGGIYYETSDTGFTSCKNTYNNFYNVTTTYQGNASQGTGEKTLNPNYNTATYGDGAYLMVPSALKGQGNGGGDIGAEVLYRYLDGVLTSTPLWPWPMEDRIYAERGISVTWEANGGLWKTLDGVYNIP